MKADKLRLVSTLADPLLDGEVTYNSALNKFRKKENGTVSDLDKKVLRTITFGVYNSDGITPITIGGKISTKIQSPYTGTIVGWKLTSNVSTSTVVDIWKHITNPTNANSITASAKPTLTAQSKNDSSTLTGWVTSVTENDLLQIEIESNDLSTDLKLILIIEV
jgi:hypothetical protein